MATSTSGGLSDREAIALAVRPWRPASPPVVTTVTPVANWPMILRCFLESKVMKEAHFHVDRRRRRRYLRPVTKKHAEATRPKIIGANRGNHTMGNMARNVTAACG